MIPDGRGEAVDAVLALGLGVESRESAEAIVERVAALLRFAPMGDNHHNAAACPHCSHGVVVLPVAVARRLLDVVNAVHGGEGGHYTDSIEADWRMLTERVERAER